MSLDKLTVLSAVPRNLAVALFLLAVSVAPAPVLRACDVPVHRYILQRWEREDYRVYYFFRGNVAEADRHVNEFLSDAADGFGSHVNLAFRALNVDRLADNPAAEEEQKLWKDCASDKLPLHLVLSPRGTLLFRGHLDMPAAKAMIQSPARTEIARQLSEGKGGLLLLLAGDDAKETEKAEKDVRWVLERAKKEHGLDVGFLRLPAKAPDEQWFVRFLLDAAARPPDDRQSLVFGICGRARVLGVLVAEHITRRNLVECVAMMNGECSCDLMYGNLGMDLLTDWDWDGAAANLPPVNVEPLRSILLGFDDSEENSPGLPRRESHARAGNAGWSVFRASGFPHWFLVFALASVVVGAIGFVILRRRKEG
jgi:hypothetical protein